jgi:Coenzyme PQQ synthesis protein D (PqqD).
VLNPSAREIYLLYQDGKSITEILTIMQQKFDIEDTQQLSDDIKICITQLKAQKII